MSRRTGAVARNTGFYSTSAVLAVLFLFPMVWTLYSSVHGQQATNGADAQGFGLANYRRLFDYGAGISTYLINSVVVSLITVVVTVVVATFGGYAIARFTFPGKNLLFLVTLAILMVPYTTILIPLYVFQLPFGLFMMRNSFEALPIELEESALIDGCSPTGALRRVLLRGVTPGLVTVGLFAFLASWNEFVAPLIFLTNGDKFTLTLALFNLQSGNSNVVDFGALQSGVVIAAVPCIVIFLFLQRFYVRGFSSGAVKG